MKTSTAHRQILFLDPSSIHLIQNSRKSRHAKNGLESLRSLKCNDSAERKWRMHVGNVEAAKARSHKSSREEGRREQPQHASRASSFHDVEEKSSREGTQRERERPAVLQRHTTLTNPSHYM
ncbi:hypothetical protein Mapa_004821 [Marchantia paleacea]|nr:hypothetical protein Mapa_004821 [Marchantia paleacea]